MLPVLRKSSLICRLVLAWFALTLGAAIAAPIVHGRAVELVCSDAGMPQPVVPDEDGKATRTVGQHALDCPLCLAASTAPPPSPGFAAAGDMPRAPDRAPVVRFPAPSAVASGAPLPARGPPPSIAPT